VTEDDLLRLVGQLPGVRVVTASRDTGAPEVAWGDSFVSYDPTGTGEGMERQPFATLVTKDYPGFDVASDLDRAGVFRVNVNVGRETFEELFGYPPSAAADHAGDYDFTALDTVLPHPVYGGQGWVCVLNPGDRTAGQLELLLRRAHSLAAGRFQRHQQR
jgi:Family of unknown function (DUF6194)